MHAAAYGETHLQGRVAVRVFPKHPPIEMTRAAALHLFRLLQRYNWCLAEKDYRSRWSRFWPRIQSVERVLLVLFIKASCNGQFGRRLVAIEPPVDFERYVDNTDVAALTPLVGDEFGHLLATYYNKLGAREELYAWLKKDCPKEFGLLMASKPLRSIFGEGAWVDPEVLYGKCERAFRSDGWEHDSASALAMTLARSVLAFFAVQEAAL
ncbi:hypothetical protein FX016_23190 [Cupriavidus gilardii]|nr:hypothetical protein FX016_23190 [Cupriavidus gilardii]